MDFLPDRMRYALSDQCFYRKQYSDETFFEYAEALKMIVQIFKSGFLEKQIVEAVISGTVDLEIRSQFLSANSPRLLYS